MGGRRVAGPRPRARSTCSASALITAGLFSLVWGLIKTNTHAWTSAYTIGFLGARPCCSWRLRGLGGARRPNPMVPLGSSANGSFTASACVVAFVGFSLFGIIFFLTLYFQNVQGYSRAGGRRAPAAADR